MWLLGENACVLAAAVAPSSGRGALRWGGTKNSVFTLASCVNWRRKGCWWRGCLSRERDAAFCDRGPISLSWWESGLRDERGPLKSAARADAWPLPPPERRGVERPAGRAAPGGQPACRPPQHCHHLVSWLKKEFYATCSTGSWWPLDAFSSF